MPTQTYVPSTLIAGSDSAPETRRALLGAADASILPAVCMVGRGGTDGRHCSARPLSISRDIPTAGEWALRSRRSSHGRGEG